MARIAEWRSIGKEVTAHATSTAPGTTVGSRNLLCRCVAASHAASCTTTTSAQSALGVRAVRTCVARTTAHERAMIEIAGITDQSGRHAAPCTVGAPHPNAIHCCHGAIHTDMP